LLAPIAAILRPTALPRLHPRVRAREIVRVLCGRFVLVNK
jgi:hypothetical protein